VLREKSIVIYDLFHIEVEYRNIGSRPSESSGASGPIERSVVLARFGCKTYIDLSWLLQWLKPGFDFSSIVNCHDGGNQKILRWIVGFVLANQVLYPANSESRLIPARLWPHLHLTNSM
jgi:hypothetical protein